MIVGPFETRKIFFFDWDNTVIGVLLLPKCIKDARAFVNFFVAVNMIHPELDPYWDEWFWERTAKRRQAKENWPRRRVCPEEAFYFAPDGAGGLELRHSLRFVPAEYIKQAGMARSKGFRPGKGDVKDDP